MLPERVASGTALAAFRDIREIGAPQISIPLSAGVLPLDLDKDLSTSLRDPERVAAVRRTGLLNAPPDPAIERLTRLARRLLSCPAAFLCLMEEDAQFLAGATGLPEAANTRRTPLCQSFCQYAVAARADFVIADAREHELLRDDPAVREKGLIAYAGVPLLTPDGHALGTFCVMDHAPHHWSEAELADLHDLAALATIEIHRRLQAVTSLPADSDARLSYGALPALVWTATPDGSCDYVNERWLEFTGRPAAAEFGNGWLERMHPDDRASALEQFHDALARRRPFHLEFRLQRHDGQYRWLHDAGVPRFGADGALLGFVGCATDVTERRQLAQRLVRAERAQAIGQLAGGVAHDFNNLLTGIIGHVALLQEEPGLSELAREDLLQIQRSADRASSLTRQLLAFSRRQVLAPRVLDLNQLVSGRLSSLRRLVGARVQVVWNPAASVDPIVADPNQLEQVLSQLSANARDSMPDGGTLELTTRQERLESVEGTRLSGTHRSGTYVVLQVRDTGRGMDAATLERIFEPFFSTKNPSEGAGLGLASVYGIVKQSGGHIEVASEPGRGTSFTIYFPRHEGSGPVGTAAMAEEPAGGNETILLVEDEEQVRELARRVLERVGYTVLAAANAAAATAIADRHPGHIHLLVTDMLLPQLGGRELAARLSIHRPAIKVLYISGSSDGSIARLRMIEPGTGFLEKPFSLDRLLRTVRQALGDPDGGSRPA
jgi:PAS domain S-box-containing protein